MILSRPEKLLTIRAGFIPGNVKNYQHLLLAAFENPVLFTDCFGFQCFLQGFFIGALYLDANSISFS